MSRSSWSHWVRHSLSFCRFFEYRMMVGRGKSAMISQQDWENHPSLSTLPITLDTVIIPN